jgi:hypothetical protein
MNKKFTFIILFLLQWCISFSQQDKYSISKDKKGYLTMTNKATNEVKFVKCNTIDTISVTLINTDQAYKNFLIIRNGKTRTLFDTQNDKTIFSGEIDTLIFNEIPDAYNADSILPLKMVIKVTAVKKDKDQGLNMNVKTGKIIAISNDSDQFNYNRSLVKLISGRDDYRIVDLNGKKIIGDGEVMADLRIAFIVRKDKSFSDRGKFGVIDTNGDTIVPFNYRTLDVFAGNYFIAWDTLEKHCGVIDMHNNIIIPFEYVPTLYWDSYSSKNFPTYLYSELGAVILRKSKKKGDFVMVDTTNTILIKEGTYNDINSLNNKVSNRYFAVTAPTELKGIYDVKIKKELFTCDYTSFGGTFSISDNTDFVKKGIMVAEKNGRWGLLNLKTGKIAIPFEYDTKEVEFMTNSIQDYFLLKKNGKMGMVDITGKILIPFNYDEVNKSDNGFVIVKNMGLYGLVDANTGKEILPIEYSSMNYGVRYKKNETTGKKENYTVILFEKIVEGQLKKGFYSKESGVSWDK